ncbi:MAG: metallophosphoesterase family protein [Planctomycetota bacterium]
METATGIFVDDPDGASSPPNTGRTQQMIAIFSDVHANRAALSAVTEDLRDKDVDRLICLGDTVGYGPSPRWCVDAVRELCDVVLCGNHDFALIYGAEDFSQLAASSISYHRKLLMPRPGHSSEKTARERWDYLKSLPHRRTADNRLYVHGSPRNPIREYLRAEDCGRNSQKLADNFAQFENVCFVGHTHRPGIITSEYQFIFPRDIGVGESYTWDTGSKTIVNVGSVGQPRDGDTRACYVTLDDRSLTYHRVPYDVESVARVIEQSGLGPDLAERLREGM